MTYDENTFDDEGYAKPKEGNETWNKKAEQFNQEWRKVRETPSGSAMHERIKSDKDWTYSVDLNDHDRMPSGSEGPIRPWVAPHETESRSVAVFPNSQFDMEAVTEEMYHQMQHSAAAAFGREAGPLKMHGMGDYVAREKAGMRREGSIIPELPVYCESDYEKMLQVRGRGINASREAQAARATNIIKYEYFEKNDPAQLKKLLLPVHPLIEWKFGRKFQGFRQGYDYFHFDRPFGEKGYPRQPDISVP